jgi:WD40 repeat protein
VGIACLAAGRENVVAGTRAGHVLVGDSASGRLRPLARAGDPIQCLSLSPDESMIACGTQRGGLELFRVQDGGPVLRQTVHAERIDQVLFHPSGCYLATLSRDRNLVLWRVADGALEEVLRLTSPYRRAAAMMSFSSDGRQLGVLTPSERAVRVWDLGRLRLELDAVGLDWSGPPVSHRD